MTFICVSCDSHMTVSRNPLVHVFCQTSWRVPWGSAISSAGARSRKVGARFRASTRALEHSGLVRGRTAHARCNIFSRKVRARFAQGARKQTWLFFGARPISLHVQWCDQGRISARKHVTSQAPNIVTNLVAKNSARRKGAQGSRKVSRKRLLSGMRQPQRFLKPSYIVCNK